MGNEYQAEGRISVSGGELWYGRLGPQDSIALLVLHGGPGYPHDYLKPLSDLSDEREVIFYDQLGCGRSSRPQDESLWTVERYVEEVQQVVEALELKEFHLLGHSWGAMLALAYYEKYPERVRSMILASPSISISRWCADAEELIKALPADVQETLRRGRRKGNYSSEQYLEAQEEYNMRHVCSVMPKPYQVTCSDRNAGAEVYNYMWGPNEFTVSGTLLGVDFSNVLPRVLVPVFFSCGRFDEAAPGTLKWYARKTPNAVVKVFSKSAHLPHWKEREEYIKTVRQFLHKVEYPRPGLFSRILSLFGKNNNLQIRGQEKERA